MNSSADSRYLGFDLSTQELKAIVINNDLQICHRVSVNYDRDLPQYKTLGGVHRRQVEGDVASSQEVTAPVKMWLEAIELCFERLSRQEAFDIKLIKCISGATQRHGCVWWRHEASRLLAYGMKANLSLVDNLQDAFTLEQCPVWMDSSTTLECRRIEQQLGDNLAKITGSRAYERFTGTQIAKIFAKPEKCWIYKESEQITLISNFFASILGGSYMPFDVSDAAGMCMMDIRTKEWSYACLEAIVNDLESTTNGSKFEEPKIDKLLRLLSPPYLSDPGEVIGTVSNYFSRRFGLSPDCLLASFTGDTPTSMAGLCVAKYELMISLGTSDTCCFWLDEPRFFENGHLSRNTIDPNYYVGLVSFKNGSRTRERIRNQYCVTNRSTTGDSIKSLGTADNSAAISWQRFNSMLDNTQPGNHGNIGFYFDMREIYPPCEGDFRFNDKDEPVSEFADAAIEVRACVEGQFMRLYNHIGEDILGSISSIKVTGGASSNGSILQVLADVFDKPVCAIDMPNSACLGAAFLAKCAYARRVKGDEILQDGLLSHDEWLKTLDNNARDPAYFENLIMRRLSEKPDLIAPTRIHQPRKQLNKVYTELRVRYKNLEQQLARRNVID